MNATANDNRQDASEKMEAALRLFMRQWNACGPNSDFGRYFSNVRDAAKEALASLEGAPK